jgi:hypothetical protein
VIGCDKLCGECEGCALIVWALEYTLQYEDEARDFHQVTNSREHHEHQALVAVGEAPDLAELLARALRGRGVDATVECNRGVQYRIIYYVGGVRVWLATNRGNPEVIPSARAKLSRLLAAGLCGPEEALRLLEES